MLVFFYGLFMDQNLLLNMGVAPSAVVPGFVNDFALRIGDRATLVPESGSRAYGLLMRLTVDEAEALYAEESVSDYLPEPIIVTLMDGRNVEATCYNLPGNKVAGSNKDYAAALLALARKLDFPNSYLVQISRAGAGQRSA